MKGVVFAYSRQGCATARRVTASLPQARWEGFLPPRLTPEAGFAPLPSPAQTVYESAFAEAEVLVFVGACGIAVREIAPFVRSKTTDPAVLCVDEGGRFVIPLLSGHIGGANRLARQVAAELGATAVITTATDCSGRFSVDDWAARQGVVIDDMALAKAVSAAVLEGEVALESDFPVMTDYPAGIVPGGAGELGILLSCRKARPFSQTLRLIPRVLHLGIGCRRGVTAEAVAAAVETVLEEQGLDERAVRCAASIDLKAQEAGLLACCREHRWPLRFYTAEELQAVEGTFTPSPFVETVTGVDNVCERAALAGAEELLVRKTAVDGVTVAVAAEKWEVYFG